MQQLGWKETRRVDSALEGSTKVYEKSDGKHKAVVIAYETYTDENRTELEKQTIYGPVYGPNR